VSWHVLGELYIELDAQVVWRTRINLGTKKPDARNLKKNWINESKFQSNLK
jgi:hypothetical protein